MTSTPAAVTGGCLCGAVRYTLTAEPVAVRRCWCRLCQYLAAGTATANAIVRQDALAMTGALSEFVSTAESGNVMRRHFCPACGTPIGGVADVRAHLYVLRVGTLDDPDLYPPQSTIWTDAAPRWALIDHDRPTLPGQPPAPVIPAPGTA